MSKNFKFFIAAFLISVFFWGGFNVVTQNFENFLFAEVYRNPSELLLAQANLATLQKIKKEPPEIAAESAISVKVYKAGGEKIIFEKNPDQTLPVASLTKLMTALVSLEYYNPAEKVEVSKSAVDQPDNAGLLRIGERLTVESLLYVMLIESSNDSAFALSELISEEAFVDLMNIEARDLGLNNTHFTDPTGYNPGNRSTARDLAKLSKHILDKKPAIWEITTQKEFNLYDPDGIFHHQLISTNEMLGEISQIIGGKTGYTPEARGCLILILEDRRNGNISINVVLGSDDRFEDMRKLIEYAS